MNNMVMFSLVVVSLVLVSGAAIATSDSTMPDNLNHTIFSSIGKYNGNVTIYSNGTVSTSQAGITHSGNVFTLNSNINGSLTFLASNSILNGNGLKISNSHIGSIMVIAANNTGSTIENLRIYSPGYNTVGVEVYNTTNDNFKNINVTSTYLGFDVAQQVQQLNVSNSNFTVLSDNENSTVVLNGANPLQPISSVGLKGLPGTGNITYYSDRMTSLFTSIVFISFENHINVLDSNLTSVSNKSIINSISLGNNTVFRGDSFIINNNEFGISLGYPFGLLSYAPHDDLFVGNSVKVNSSLAVALISIANSTIVSGNSFSLTHYGVSLYATIYDGGNNNSIMDNTINLTSFNSGYGILGNLSNTRISGNLIYETQNSGSSGGIDLTGDNMSVISNKVVLNGSENEAGISLYGGSKGSYAPNNNVSDNSITITNSSAAGMFLGSGDRGISSTVVSGNTVSIGGKDPNGIVYLGSNNSFKGNDIYINSTASSTGIGSFEVNRASSFDHISGNYIHSYLASSGGQFGFYFEYSLNNSIISDNYFKSDSSQGSGIQLNAISNHDSLYSNTFIFPVSRNADSGLNFNSFLNGTVSNNSLYNMNTTLNWNSVHHAVVNGNYFYNEYTAIHLGDSNNLTFYQNDFVNFTQALILSGKYSNITFNSSYPVGGNYWSNYTGSDKYSGPGQNIPGSDGIGDTPYSIGYGLMDKYPLMKPWIRPAVTFTESGLAAGKSWSVQFDGNIYSTDNNSISFLIHNSTYQKYRYALQNVSGYYFNSSPSGNFSYSGNGTTYSFVYHHFAYLTGTVSPGQVTVKIGNTTYNITDGVFNISLKAGSYKIEFIHSGYVTLTYQLTLNAGENKNLTVSLTKPSSDIIYYIVGGIAAVVVAGGAAFAIYRKK